MCFTVLSLMSDSSIIPRLVCVSKGINKKQCMNSERARSAMENLPVPTVHGWAKIALSPMMY